MREIIARLASLGFFPCPRIWIRCSLDGNYMCSSHPLYHSIRIGWLAFFFFYIFFMLNKNFNYKKIWVIRSRSNGAESEKYAGSFHPKRTESNCLVVICMHLIFLWLVYPITGLVWHSTRFSSILLKFYLLVLVYD